MLMMVLASQSPRRKELLNIAGIHFHHHPVKVSEIFDEKLKPAENASQLATLKARACVDQHKQLKLGKFLVLAADTIVTLDGQMLGKPESAGEATEFLRRLSGKTHSVISGLALLEVGAGKLWSGSDETQVEFKKLSENEISEYVSSGEPMDKAGAYAIQGLGGKLVANFRGSKSNVIGLPLELLEKALKENGWNVHRNSP
jgi:septum formation protein